MRRWKSSPPIFIYRKEREEYKKLLSKRLQHIKMELGEYKEAIELATAQQRKLNLKRGQTLLHGARSGDNSEGQSAEENVNRLTQETRLKIQQSRNLLHTINQIDQTHEVVQNPASSGIEMQPMPSTSEQDNTAFIFQVEFILEECAAVFGAEVEVEFGDLSLVTHVSDKFMSQKLITGQPVDAAHGLAVFMGISTEREGEIKLHGLAAIREEFLQLEVKVAQLETDAATPIEKENAKKEKEQAAKDITTMKYILDQPAEEQVNDSNDGNSTIVRDKGHNGMLLLDFKRHPTAVAARLEEAHVAALRLYTSTAYGRINIPLRNQEKPHPFAATTIFLSEALKKLRSVHAGQEASEHHEFWRGMKNLQLTEDFMKHGGTELGCMSTSTDKDIVASYARSQQPLVFRVISEGFMSRGADISWLSVYPGEAEILYPPLTYLKFERSYKIKNSAGTLVDVTPQFAT
jgi:hypothetical protein